jgi:hypothetical protein
VDRPRLDFAKYVESIDETAHQVLKPGASDDDVVEHYRKIANAVRLPIVSHGNYAMPLLE